MTRIDRIVLGRVAARTALTVVVFFGLLCLVESLDTRRVDILTSVGGPILAIIGITVGAGRTILGTLAVTVLIGTIIAVLDLQSRRELTVIKASGISTWRVMRAPLLAAVGLGLAASLVVTPFTIGVSRELPTASRGDSGPIWLEQRGGDGAYILHAGGTSQRGQSLSDVTLFFTDAGDRRRIHAESAKLSNGAWQLTSVVVASAQTPSLEAESLEVATTSTVADMQLRLTSARDLTFAELVNVVSGNLADPTLRAGATTSILRLLAQPGLLAGSVLIGFAFTSGYRRTNKYGGAVLYGIVLGFVVYVVTELANRSGFAGVLDPAFAAVGPAFVAIIIGLTVLLFKEDGRV